MRDGMTRYLNWVLKRCFKFIVNEFSFIICKVRLLFFLYSNPGTGPDCCLTESCTEVRKLIRLNHLM